MPSTLDKSIPCHTPLSHSEFSLHSSRMQRMLRMCICNQLFTMYRKYHELSLLSRVLQSCLDNLWYFSVHSEYPAATYSAAAYVPCILGCSLEQTRTHEFLCTLGADNSHLIFHPISCVRCTYLLCSSCSFRYTLIPFQEPPLVTFWVHFHILMHADK